MPVPVAIPFSQILGTAGTATVLGKPSENKTEEDVVPFSDVLAKRFSQNLSSILQKTIDTPSGKVFAPDDPIPAKPNILATYPQSKDQPWIMGSPMPTGEPQGIMGLPMPETQDKLKGFETPLSPNFNILNKEDTSYRIQHQPRGPESENPVRLDDLTKSITGERAGYPNDFYSDKGQRIYAPGPRFENDEFGIANQESFQIINKVKNKPDEEITIYRAVPNNDNIKDINKGDFVTLSKKYAELHGASGYGEYGNDIGKILEKKVKVKDIYWDQNDVNEFGYFPTQDLPVEDIQKQIQVKKSKMKNTYDFIYNGKIVGQIEKRDEKFEGLNDYNLIDTSISEGGPFDAQLGFNDAKSYMLSGITNRIKNKEIDLNDYKLIEDFYGDIIKTKKEITSNPVGSLIDKPLSDETN
jgi:hypothetical protein